MSDQFRSLRHLTQHVDEQARIYSQLQEAIASVSGLLDRLPEKQRELTELEAKLAEVTQKTAEAAAAQRVLAEQTLKQRRDMQALLQKEQQERVTAREAFRLEAQTHHQELQALRNTLADLQREIDRRRGEADTLEKELASTVSKVLRR